MILSIEASISLAFFTMLSDQQAAFHAAQAKSQDEIVQEIRRLAKSTLVLAEGQKELLAENLTILKAMRDRDAATLKEME